MSNPIARFFPGKLSDKQRDLIMRAVEFPLCSHEVQVGEWPQLNGLVKRGLMEERETNTFFLTGKGRFVSEAVERLRHD
jgi:predicted transcriptional regulator